MRIRTRSCEDRLSASQESIDQFQNQIWWFAGLSLEERIRARESTLEDVEADIIRTAHGEMEDQTPIAIVYCRHLEGKRPGEVGGVCLSIYERLKHMGIVRDATQEELDRHLASTGDHTPMTLRDAARAHRVAGARYRNKDLARRHAALDRKG